MKDAGSPPPPPDPAATASAQSQANIATAIANARLNRVNQTTPWGNITYTPGDVDANGVPSYSSNISLNPQQQQLLDSQRQQQLQRSGIAQSLLDQAGGALGKPLDLSHLHPVYDRYAPSGQATPAVGAQSPQGQSQSPNAQSREAMLAQLQQYMQQQGGGASVGANPAARAAGILRETGAPAAQAQAAPASPSALPTGQPAYGSIGQNLQDIGAGFNGKTPDGLDKFYKDQFVYNEPGESSPGGWSLNGLLKTRDGRQVVQIGGPKGEAFNGQHGGSHVIDQSKNFHDPEVGWVTPAENVGGTMGSFTGRDWASAASVLGAGLGSAAMGGAFGAAPEVGTGAFDVGGSTGFGGSTPIGAAAPVGAAPVSEIMPQAAGNYAPVTDLSTQAATPGIGSQMMNNLSSGRGLLGLNRGVSAGGGLLAQLLRKMGTQGGQR